MHFTTDACLDHGGVTCLERCLTFTFSAFVLSAAINIFALKLFTVIVAVKFQAPVSQYQRFLVSCNNKVAVTVINLGSIKDIFMQRCLRKLWFISALYNFELPACYIPSKRNSLADALSRTHCISHHTRQNFLAWPPNLGSLTFLMDTRRLCLL